MNPVLQTTQAYPRHRGTWWVSAEHAPDACQAARVPHDSGPDDGTAGLPGDSEGRMTIDTEFEGWVCRNVQRGGRVHLVRK